MILNSSRRMPLNNWRPESLFPARMEYWYPCWRIYLTVPLKERWTAIWKAVNASLATAATVIWASRYRPQWAKWQYTPRDRDGTFDPQVVRKREKILTDSLADRIIGLCGIGNSTREISDILEEQFGNRISAETISSITDRVLSEIQNGIYFLSETRILRFSLVSCIFKKVLNQTSFSFIRTNIGE